MEKSRNKINTEKQKIVFESKIIKRFSLIFFAKLIGEITFFIVSNILLINWLNIESNHDYIIFLTTVYFIFSLIMTFHLALPKFLQKDSRELRRSYIFNGLFILMLNFIIIVIIFMIITFGFNFDYNVFHPNSEFLVFFLLGALAYEFFRFFESVLFGLKLSNKIAVVHLLLSMSFLLMSIVFIVIFNHGFIGAVLTYIISFFLIDGFSFYFIFKALRREKTRNQKEKSEKFLDKAIQKELFLFCLPIFTSNLFYFLNTRFGTLILNSLHDGSSEIFHFSLTLTVYLIGLLGLTINDLLLPYESDAYYHDDQNKIKEIYKLIFTFVVVIIIPFLLVCIVFSNLILGILYSNYFIQFPIFVDIFQLMLVGGFFYCLNQFTAKFLVAKGLTIRFLVIQIIGGSLNALFLIIFLPFIGIYSAIWGFIISMAVMFLLYFYSLTKIIELSIWQFKLIQLVISIIVVIFEFFILKLGFGLNFIVIGVVCLPSYFILLFGFRILKFKDIKIFLNNLRIIFFKIKRV